MLQIVRLKFLILFKNAVSGFVCPQYYIFGDRDLYYDLQKKQERVGRVPFRKTALASSWSRK